MGCLNNTRPSQLLKGSDPYRPFGQWPKEIEDPPLSLSVARRSNSAIIGDEVGQGVAGEETWTKRDSIRGIHHAVLWRSTARTTTGRGYRHHPLPLLLIGFSNDLH
jgi:hypothetical protein